jgi:hypothetical protein
VRAVVAMPLNEKITKVIETREASWTAAALRRFSAAWGQRMDFASRSDRQTRLQPLSTQFAPFPHSKKNSFSGHP